MYRIGTHSVDFVGSRPTAALSPLSASAATLIDFDVHAGGSVSIGGGSYGVIGAGGANFISRTVATTAVTAEAAKLPTCARSPAAPRGASSTAGGGR